MFTYKVVITVIVISQFVLKELLEMSFLVIVTYCVTKATIIGFLNDATRRGTKAFVHDFLALTSHFNALKLSHLKDSCASGISGYNTKSGMNALKVAPERVASRA